MLITTTPLPTPQIHSIEIDRLELLSLVMIINLLNQSNKLENLVSL